MTTSKFCPSGKPLRVRLARRFNARVTARAEKVVYASETPEARVGRFKKEFSAERPLDPMTKTAASLGSGALAALSAVAAVGAAGAAFLGASKLPVEGTVGKVAQGGAAVITGGAVVAGGKKLQEKRDTAAGVELWNALATAEDPASPDPAIGRTLRERFGDSPEVIEGIKRAYFSYLQVLIPPASVSLAGDEAKKAREFLDSVGLPDEEAAPVHIDVGRTFFRQNLEHGDAKGAADGIKQFQKLVYVSTQLFGEMRAGFLTPWVARFQNVSPEQVKVANREGARMIMEGRMATELGGTLPATAEAMRTLRGIQRNVGLTDEGCASLVKELLAADTEAALTSAIADMNVRGSKPSEHERAIATVDELLQRSRAFAQLKAAAPAEDLEAMVPGVDALTVSDTLYASGHTNALVDLYRFYMRSKMDQADTALPVGLDASLDELARLLALPADRVERVRGTLVAESYERLLRDAVTSGRMDEAESPAALLNDLITRVRMPGEQASALHEEFYRQKLRDCLADKRIDDEDEAGLRRTARLLCLDDATVAAADAAAKGDILRVAIRDALDLGADRFSADAADEVRDVKEALRMSDQDAVELLKEQGRARIVALINTARNKSSQLENAKELKKVVLFSNSVLAPLLVALRGKSEAEKKDDAMKEIAETLAKAKAEVDAQAAAEGDGADASDGTDPTDVGEREPSVAAEEEAGEASAASEAVPSSLAKAEQAKAEVEAGAGKAAEDEESAPGQKEIRVGDEDFGKQDRLDIYKTYLTYCMTGEVVTLPMGGTIVLERDQSEFARLAQLGDLLDLNQMDLYGVHTDMAEEAFKGQAEAAAPGGVLSDDAREGLQEMATKMGLSDEKAESIMRKVTNKRVVGNMEHMKSRGELTLEKVLELVDQDADVGSVLGHGARLKLYEEHIAKQLSAGVGTIDAEQLLTELPARLQLDSKAAKEAAQSIAKDKARPTFVQSMAGYRTKDHASAMKNLKNLLACARVRTPDEATVKWDAKKEVGDMYGLFCTEVKDAGAREEMAELLRVSAEERASLQEAADAGTFSAGAAIKAGGRQNESFF